MGRVLDENKLPSAINFTRQLIRSPAYTDRIKYICRSRLFTVTLLQ